MRQNPSDIAFTPAVKNIRPRKAHHPITPRWDFFCENCHHRTQVQSWLRLAGHEPVPAIYGPSGDVKWDEADST